ncbi:MAG: hypothetical protein AAGD32_10525 [Planctomycetota bacterium]
MPEVPWQLQIFIAQMGTSGVLWTAVYVLIIVAGAKDKACGMPLAALCANLAWEFIYVFIYPHPWYQLPADVLWLTLDCIIAYQAVRYFNANHPRLELWQFLGMFAAGLVTAGCAIGFIGNAFDDPDGVYAAFAQNLMMSILFVGWLANRAGLPAQRLSIAILKMLGTLAASSAFVTFVFTDPEQQVRKAPLTPLLAFLFTATLVFDCMYIAGVWRRKRRMTSASA